MRCDCSLVLYRCVHGGLAFDFFRDAKGVVMSGNVALWVAVVIFAYFVGFSDGAFSVADEIDRQAAVLGWAR